MNIRSVRSLASLMGVGFLVFGIFTSIQPAVAKDENCQGARPAVTLAAEPVQINPGARCNMSFTFRMERVGLVLDVPVCFYAKQAGRDKKLGPFCVNRPSSQRLPDNVEWLWSAGQAVIVYPTLSPRGQR